MITLEVHGRPVPWRAPYVGKKGAFSPHTVKKHEAQWQLKSHFNQDPWKSAIYLKLAFYFAVPKNTSYVKRQQMLNGTLHFSKRPDLSNCVKFLEDAGTGILWDDDSQIVELDARKLYGTTEKTILIMKEISLWGE